MKPKFNGFQTKNYNSMTIENKMTDSAMATLHFNV